MFIRVLRESPNELEIEIEGENHTFCNPLQKVILEDRNVELAGYDIPHPLISNTKFFIRTKGESDPRTVLKKAIDKLRKQNEEFREAFKDAVSE